MRVTSRLTLIGALVLTACKAQPSPDPTQVAAGCHEDAPAVDETLLAFLSKARAVHLQVDLAEADAKIDEAVRLLDGLVRPPAPGGENASPEVAEVLADSLARLAELEGQRGNFEAARVLVRRGLGIAKGRTQFRGRLFEVLGSVEKRSFDALRERRDDEGATAAKLRSLAALKEAVSIQEDVIDRALGTAPSP